ncbi:uncharacterized protein SPSK_05544 [Sporothrix schenckii 1099-18]|uniref:Uncharacterized protein n=1 Tax=Sporothrix schenckii 1099-18 TaxID=1397361 RepID=A0A0F2LW91_SPOSC|nr:uncharacterized protein SPSK_05544 [Sporothrix schenckii 1099-18]KJR81099.1 hypothetical protein SPSK_05544 [Sporothrix schenckii 1099-18]
MKNGKREGKEGVSREGGKERGSLGGCSCIKKEGEGQGRERKEAGDRRKGTTQGRESENQRWSETPHVGVTGGVVVARPADGDLSSFKALAAGGFDDYDYGTGALCPWRKEATRLCNIGWPCSFEVYFGKEPGVRECVRYGSRRWQQTSARANKGKSKAPSAPYSKWKEAAPILGVDSRGRRWASNDSLVWRYDVCSACVMDSVEWGGLRSIWAQVAERDVGNLARRADTDTLCFCLLVERTQASRANQGR